MHEQYVQMFQSIVIIARSKPLLHDMLLRSLSPSHLKRVSRLAAWQKKNTVVHLPTVLYINRVRVYLSFVRKVLTEAFRHLTRRPPPASGGLDCLGGWDMRMRLVNRDRDNPRWRGLLQQLRYQKGSKQGNHGIVLC
jgi:hypothetical protein